MVTEPFHERYRRFSIDVFDERIGAPSVNTKAINLKADLVGPGAGVHIDFIWAYVAEFGIVRMAEDNDVDPRKPF